MTLAEKGTDMEQKQALLLLSFGTSCAEAGERSIGAIEQELQNAFPERRFFRAWSSTRLRKKAAGSGLYYDSLPEALARMQAQGIEDVLLQPTHMMLGMEYRQICAQAEEWRPRFSALRLGAPLLATPDDLYSLAAAIEASYPALTEREMLVWMGHGVAETEFPAYTLLDELFRQKGRENICVGTVSYSPGLAPVLARIRQRRPERVYLAPLLLVAGEHAIRDMAGEGADSWQAQIAALGTKPLCILKGLGEYAAVRAIYLAHAKAAEKE